METIQKAAVAIVGAMTSNALLTSVAPSTPRDQLDDAELVARIARDHADITEQQRSLARPVAEALVESQLFSLAASTELGGAAVHPAHLVDVIATVAAGDPSAGWCLAIGNGANHLIGRFPRSAAVELSTDLARPSCATFAPGGIGAPVPGGYRLTGRWSFMSGCRQSVNLVGAFLVGDAHGAPVMGPDGPLIRLAASRMADATIIDTWDTLGMCGTGSDDVAVDAAMIAEDHTTHLGAPSWSEDAIFRLHPFAVLMPTLAAAALGTGRGALDTIEADAVAQFEGPPRPGPRPKFADDPFHQVALGGAEVRLRAARLLLLDALDAAYQVAVSGHVVPRSANALIGLACGEAMQAAVHAVDVACAIKGTDAVRGRSTLQRSRRDITTMRTHVAFSPTVAQPLGRQIAGIPTMAFPLLTEPL